MRKSDVSMISLAGYSRLGEFFLIHPGLEERTNAFERPCQHLNAEVKTSPVDGSEQSCLDDVGTRRLLG